MRPWVWALTLALALPAAADQKDKKEKDKKAAEKPAAVTPADLMAQAEQKVASGDRDGAVELLRKAASMEGAGGEPSLRLGRVLESTYDLDSAVDAYRVAAEQLSGPAKGEALGRMSVVQETRGMPEATATAETAVAVDPSGAWPLIAAARARAREKKGDEAVALAEKAVAAGGGASASTALGYAQEARGDLTAAEAAYRSASEAEPDRIGAKVGLARVLRKTDRAAEAEPILQAVLASAPGAIEAYKESARVKLAQGRASEAMGDAATAAAMAEGDAEAQQVMQEVTIAKALESLRSNQPDLAVQDLTALRDKNPDLAEARVGLAKALLAKRQTEPALAELAKAVELKPDLAEAHYQLAYVHHFVKRDAAAALPHYEKAVAADPGNVEYRTNLGAALVAAKQFDRAAEELTKVVDSPGYKQPVAWIYLGQAHLGAKRYKNAIPPLEKAAEIAPESPDAAASLAWSYFGLKDAEGFKKYGAKARSLGHKEPTLLQYLSRVEGGEPIK